MLNSPKTLYLSDEEREMIEEIIIEINKERQLTGKKPMTISKKLHEILKKGLLAEKAKLSK